MNPELVAEFLRKEPVPAGMREVLLKHMETIDGKQVMAIARAWYEQDPDSLEVFIRPLPAALRAALRDYLHRDFMARYVYK